MLSCRRKATLKNHSAKYVDLLLCLTFAFYDLKYTLQEPMNLTNLASKRYNGLVHDNSIGVESAPNNKGFTVITKKRKLAVSYNLIF